MIFGKQDLDIVIETNIHRWDKFKKDLSDHSVDRFVKRALGMIDDMVDASESSSPDSSLAAMRRARSLLDKFLDEWEKRKPGRSRSAGVECPIVSDEDGDEVADDEDEDEDEEPDTDD